MTFPDHAKKYIDEFLASIKPIETAYKNDTFSYLAVKADDGFVLVQGTLYLNTQTPKLPIGKFESSRVKAGHFFLHEMKCNRQEFVDQIGSGKLQTPHGELLFPPNGQSNGFGANYFPFHEVGLQTQRRLAVLSILGAESGNYIHANQPHLDWDVRAAAIPYDGVQELLVEYGPGMLQGVNRIDIAAYDLAAIDANSIVQGETARLMVRTVKNAPVDKIAVGFRVLEQGHVIQRGRLLGEEFKWQKHDDVQIGVKEIAVPKAAVVHAFALYDGVVYHHYYFGDPTSFQNPRRAAYEAFDPKLDILNDILEKTRGIKPDSKTFEASMPWLFWMLGFSPAHIGGPPRMTDAPDFLFSTPNGNIAVVECTVGLLKEDSKLPKLHDRTEAVRRNLSQSKMGHVRVLSVIITAKTTAEIRPDIDQAEKLGVCVIARDGIRQLIERTLFLQNADQLFEQAEQAVIAAMAKYEERDL